MDILVFKNKANGRAEPVATHSNAVQVEQDGSKKTLTTVLDAMAEEISQLGIVFASQDTCRDIVSELT